MAKYAFIGGLLALLAGIIGFILSFRYYDMWDGEWVSFNIINVFLVLFGITFIAAGFERED